MDNVINKLSRDSIDYNYSLDFKGLKIKDKADDGTEYNKTIYYMEHKAIIDDALLEIMDKENTYVRKVVRYIAKNIPYGVNHISLSNKDIAEYYNCDKSNISKGIKRLVELDVIGRLYDKIPNNMLPKNTYIINHNYIYRGSIKKLRKDILEQRNNITN